LWLVIICAMCCCVIKVKKGKGFPFSLTSVGLGADPGVEAVGPQVTISHPPGGRLPLLSARPAVTFPAAEHHRPLVGTILYCLVTEAHRCEQLGCYAAFARVGFEPTTNTTKVLFCRSLGNGGLELQCSFCERSGPHFGTRAAG